MYSLVSEVAFSFGFRHVQHRNCTFPFGFCTLLTNSSALPSPSPPHLRAGAVRTPTRTGPEEAEDRRDGTRRAAEGSVWPTAYPRPRCFSLGIWPPGRPRASLGARFEAINREPQYGQSIWWPVSGSGNQAGTGLNSPAKSDSFPATSRPLPTTPLDFRLRPWFASWHYDGG